MCHPTLGFFVAPAHRVPEQEQSGAETQLTEGSLQREMLRWDVRSVDKRARDKERKRGAGSERNDLRTGANYLALLIPFEA